MALRDLKIFVPTANTRSFFKIAIDGFPGSGKSYTLALLALGIWQEGGKKQPIVVQDTENTSKFLTPFFLSHGAVEGETYFVTKSRSIMDFQTLTRETEEEGGILFVDSMTHLFDQMIEEYRRKRNLQDVSPLQRVKLRPLWRERVTEPLVHSNCHILFTGRASWDWNMVELEPEEGEQPRFRPKKELQRVGIKMRGDTEILYEPDIAILMERHDEPTGADNHLVTYRTATILKSRYAPLDGKIFRYNNDDKGNKPFEDFREAFAFLTKGELPAQGRVETPIQSAFGDNREWNVEIEQRRILCEEIKELLVSAFPSQSAADKKMRGDTMFVCFGTRSWTAIENMDSAKLQHGLGIATPICQEIERAITHGEEVPSGSDFMSHIQRLKEQYEAGDAPTSEEEEDNVPEFADEPPAAE